MFLKDMNLLGQPVVNSLFPSALFQWNGSDYWCYLCVQPLQPCSHPMFYRQGKAARRQVRGAQSQTQSHQFGLPCLWKSISSSPGVCVADTDLLIATCLQKLQKFGWRLRSRVMSPATAHHACQSTAQTRFSEVAGLQLCCVITYTQRHLRNLVGKKQVMGKTELFRPNLSFVELNRNFATDPNDHGIFAKYEY